MQRQSNLELCRIISILFIVIIHSCFAVFGWPTNLNESKWPLIIAEAFSIVGVNVFLIITGYFSTKPKFSSLLNLFYICFFYAALKIIFDYAIGLDISFKKFFFISRSNWFIPCYLGLVLFTPLLNRACDSFDKRQFQMFLFSVLVFVAWFGFAPALPQIPIGIHNGCSILHFIIMYLIGRYIRLFGLPRLFNKYSFLFYLISSISVVGLTYPLLYHGVNEKVIQRLFANSNPIIIFSAVSFFLTFKNINLGYNKYINYIAKSVLAVLLVHGSGEAIRYLNPQYIFIYNHFHGLLLFVYWSISIIVTFLFAVLIDQVRLYSYKILSKYIIKS